MGWFSHTHSWWDATTYPIKGGEYGGNSGVVVVQQCSCGAVRTVEVKPGKAPVIRMGESF